MTWVKVFGFDTRLNPLLAWFLWSWPDVRSDSVVVIVHAVINITSLSGS